MIIELDVIFNAFVELFLVWHEEKYVFSVLRWEKNDSIQALSRQFPLRE